MFSDPWLLASAVMVASGVSSAVALQFLDAPYGKFAPEKASYWGPLIPAHWAWCIQESPAILAMLYCWLVLADSQHAHATSNQVLAAMFSFHYIVRSWIFPFLLNQSKPSPLVVVLLAFVFCLWNGLLQGTYLFVSPSSLDVAEKDWLSLWRVRIGIALFFFGWIANQHADHVLRHLRDKKPGDAKKNDGDDAQSSQRYHIPHGGLFEWTSAANYTGEIIEWFGFALAAWSIPALAFFMFTLSNLVPRGVSYHRWYKKTFPNYPKQRKAVIPFLL